MVVLGVEGFVCLMRFKERAGAGLVELSSWSLSETTKASGFGESGLRFRPAIA